uniref:Regulator of microtubule dynamics protein 1 n=1 Tax=Ditylenchus dipsaci TaxID=166011 RepID=A0A915CVD1_9BILA
MTEQEFLQNIDECYDKGEGQLAYDALKKIYNSNPSQQDNVEVLWRLARATHQISAQFLAKDSKKKEMLLEGQKYAEKAVQLYEKHLEAIKWAAVLTGALSNLLGTKDRIMQGYVFKNHLDKGLSIDPSEYLLLHMRGRFAYSVASLSWLEKSVASTLFATPPKATFQEALCDFLQVEMIRPNQWIENLLYLAKTYIAVSDKGNAAKYLKMASQLPQVDDVDKEAMVEVKTLMKKYK